MKKRFLKVFILLFVFVNITNFVMAETINQEDLIEKVIISNRNDMPQELKDLYNSFKNLVVTKSSYEDIASGWLFFNDNNDKLLIGNSGAVYCGHTMKKELLLEYGYDLVGFGGIFDEDLVDLLKLIEDKKYKEIVFFGGVNDLNIRAISRCNDVDLYYCRVLIKMLDEAKKHLIDDNSSVYYVKIKPMTLGRDFDDIDFVERFNNMAEQVNDNIELFGFKSYEIPFSTVPEYTDHYVHYNNKIVYETMFNAID